MKLRLLSVVPVVGALAAGCSFEADLPDVEVTQRDLKVAGVPGASLVGDVSVTSFFTLSSSDTAWAKGMKSDVFVHQVRIDASASVANLDFIRFARMTVAAPALSEGTTEIMDFERGDEPPSSSVIEINIPAPADIANLWSADTTVIEVQMAGQLPERDWTVDVTLSLSGRITYKF